MTCLFGRAKPINETPHILAVSTAIDVGADTATRRGTLEIATLLTISKLALLVTVINPNFSTFCLMI